MEQGSGIAEAVVEVPETPVPELQLLVTLEPSTRVFFRNLADLVWSKRQEPLLLVSWPAPFWPDVFVASRQPWGGAAVSAAGHVLACALVLLGVRYLPKQSLPLQTQAINHHDVIYYSPSEYLPPLQTGDSKPAAAGKADPEYAPQPIISVPPEADNRTQTIVAPPNVKLQHDVPLPNIVAWEKEQPAVPLGATSRLTPASPSISANVVAPAPEISDSIGRRDESLTASVVAPAPEVDLAADRKSLQGPAASVVAPPPELGATPVRRAGDLNIGHSSVVAPAPELPVADQRSFAGSSQPRLGTASAVAPPPSISPSISGGTPGGVGRLIALNVRPMAPPGPVEPPGGNRRGTFAATPEGKHGASGNPGSSSADDGKGGGAKHGDHPGGNGSGTQTATDLPPGLKVGTPPQASTAPVGGQGSGGGIGSGSETSGVGAGKAEGNPTLLAKVTPPRVSVPPRAIPDVSGRNANEVAQQVFGDRKFYSMSLNMPNLNSAGGSWVIRFAELKEDGQPGDLSAPVATREVDPAYPLELMRRNVKGTVTLYAVIQADGTVEDVRVLHGIDDDLDKYATQALAKWRFRPASKNGNPVALEAVVMIPFKPILRKSAF